MDLRTNAIESMTLVGPPELGSGSIVLPRVHPTDSLVPLVPYPIPEHLRSPVYDEPMPPYPPPHRRPLPAPDNHALSVTLQLGEVLGEGGSSIVYAANAISVSKICDNPNADEPDSEPEILASFPPLAVKMARRMHRGHLAREAWFYDDMHELQGSVIPRCFGWFDAVETADFKGDTYAPSSDSDRYRGSPSYYPQPWSEELQYLSVPRNRISVIILERLGDILSECEEFPSELKQDVRTLGDDTGHVDIIDIRHNNILRVLEEPGVLTSLPSPITHRLHSWRVLDLEGCQKAHNFPHNHKLRWTDYADRLIRQLEKGHIIEPWDY